MAGNSLDEAYQALLTRQRRRLDALDDLLACDAERFRTYAARLSDTQAGHLERFGTAYLLLPLETASFLFTSTRYALTLASFMFERYAFKREQFDSRL